MAGYLQCCQCPRVGAACPADFVFITVLVVPDTFPDGNSIMMLCVSVIFVLRCAALIVVWHPLTKIYNQPESYDWISMILFVLVC